MRASVSEIVTFRKCPRLWAFQRKWAVKPSKYMQRGTEAHADVERYLQYHKELANPGAAAVAASKVATHLKDATHYALICAETQLKTVLLVESPFEVEFRGHTLIGRPDAVIEQSFGITALLQVKTTTRNLVNHVSYVMAHPHEALYGYMVKAAGGPEIKKTILVRIIFKNDTVSNILVNSITLQPGSGEMLLNGIERTLNQMDEYAASDAYQVPPHTENCVNWSTGGACPFFKACWVKGTKPEDLDNLEAARNRYPEFVGGKLNLPGTSGNRDIEDKEGYLRDNQEAS